MLTVILDIHVQGETADGHKGAPPFLGFRGDERKRTLSFILRMEGLGRVHSGETLEW